MSYGLITPVTDYMHNIMHTPQPRLNTYWKTWNWGFSFSWGRSDESVSIPSNQEILRDIQSGGRVCHNNTEPLPHHIKARTRQQCIKLLNNVLAYASYNETFSQQAERCQTLANNSEITWTWMRIATITYNCISNILGSLSLHVNQHQQHTDNIKDITTLRSENGKIIAWSRLLSRAKTAATTETNTAKIEGW